jgi:hypothetical protein
MSQSITSFISIKLIRRCGRVLIAVFVIFIAGNLFPLNLGSPEWGFDLSSKIVNSASLALVGMCLLRYSVWLDFQALTQSGTNPQISLSTSEKKERQANSSNREIAKLINTQSKIRRLALVGAISLVLLAVFQVLVFIRGASLITAQGLSASNQTDKQIKEVESKILTAPDQVIDSEWSKFQAASVPGLFAPGLDTAAKRKQLDTAFKQRSKESSLRIKQQISDARWNLARNAFRVFLMAITYAWGLYGVVKL